jgi:hypothetical protein
MDSGGPQGRIERRSCQLLLQKLGAEQACWLITGIVVSRPIARITSPSDTGEINTRIITPASWEARTCQTKTDGSLVATAVRVSA